MKYVKTLSFPNGLTMNQALALHPGQYVRLFDAKRPSRFVGISTAGVMVVLHKDRSGKKIQEQRVRCKLSAADIPQ